MEGLPMVSYLTGTMNSLVDKLAIMKNHSNSREEFSNLTQEFKKSVLSLKENIFDKLAMPKVCMNQVRELVFEIEDWIDKKPESNLLDPLDIDEIENFIAEIKQARERFTWYCDLLKIVPTEHDLAAVAPSNINIIPRLLVEEKPCHGLLDKPREKLVQYLTGKKEEMLNVVSVVGREGLGKTTLAKEIYSEIQLGGVFECQAFVSVGRRLSMTEILNDILHQVKRGSGTSLVVQEVITELRQFLDTKRYFILLDGIWSTWAWKVITCALPNNRGSRVMTTTCIIDVANYCSSYPNDLVYQIEALRDTNSKILFRSRITRQEERIADFEEVCGDMLLNMCGGMPLGIIIAADLLARKSEDPIDLKMLGKFILSSVNQYSTSDGTTKILHMSFADLSLPLRSCFLYLGVFLEYYTITKDHLIWLWIAEGFIPKGNKECLWVTGERYFNELISRRLIQPVFTCDDDQAVGCTVHTVILDFIRSISREENFFTKATELNSGPLPCDTIRRFSLDCGDEDEADTLSTSSVHLSSIRSLVVFGDVEGKPYPCWSLDFKHGENMHDTKAPGVGIKHPSSMRPLTGFHSVSNHGEEMHTTKSLGVSINVIFAFKLLRVLDLEDTRNLKNHHLKGIEELVLLRYLGLAGTGITQLPHLIGELEQLETLDLRRNIGLITSPPSVVKLQKLRHLLLPGYAAKIWKMPELEVVSGLRVESSSSFGTVVELLRKSEQLRKLGLIFNVNPTPTETDLVSFLDEIVMSKLQSLSIDFRGISIPIPQLVDSWERVTAVLPKKFEPHRFELRVRTEGLKRVPHNMGSLASLTHLLIIVEQTKAEDFLVLGGLSNLVLLDLSTYKCTETERFIIKGGIFPCLKVFSFKIRDTWMELEFEEGAMPQLQRFGRGFIASERMNKAYPDIGMERLSRLTRVHATFNCAYATLPQVEVLEATIRREVSKIANKPTLELSRKNENMMLQDEQGKHSLVPPHPFRSEVSK